MEALSKVFLIAVGGMMAVGLPLGYLGQWAGVPMLETIGWVLFWLGLTVIGIFLLIQVISSM